MIWRVILFFLLDASVAFADLPRHSLILADSFQYCGANLSKVQQIGSGTAYYSATGFSALDQLTGVAFSNGVSSANAYYANSHRLQSVTTSKSGNLQNLQYTYDQVGDILSISDGTYNGASSASISSVTYDDLHRLLSFTRNATVSDMPSTTI